MTHQQIDATLFSLMIWAGAHQLDKHVEQVNALNVFPVPDGDTGTNMNLSFSSGAKEVERKKVIMWDNWRKRYQKDC